MLVVRVNLTHLSWPTNDRRVIEYLYAHNFDANWALETGCGFDSGGVMSLEIDKRYTRMALTQLARGDDSCRRTLRFARENKWYALFRYVGGMRQSVNGTSACVFTRATRSSSRRRSRRSGCGSNTRTLRSPVLPAPDSLESTM